MRNIYASSYWQIKAKAQQGSGGNGYSMWQITRSR